MGNLSYKNALSDGIDARNVAGQELGEFEDVSDYIGDYLADGGYSNKIIEMVLNEISRENGWN